jgi:hypothetical protein
LKRRYGRSSDEAPNAAPRRVEILNAGERPMYFKPGQFGYVVGTNVSRGKRYDVYPVDGNGEYNGVAYLVSKTKEMRGGASWFTAGALRFTKRGSR